MATFEFACRNVDCAHNFDFDCCREGEDTIRFLELDESGCCVYMTNAGKDTGGMYDEAG